jgi:hypothetical protein
VNNISSHRSLHKQLSYRANRELQEIFAVASQLHSLTSALTTRISYTADTATTATSCVRWYQVENETSRRFAAATFPHSRHEQFIAEPFFGLHKTSRQQSVIPQTAEKEFSCLKDALHAICEEAVVVRSVVALVGSK